MAPLLLRIITLAVLFSHGTCMVYGQLDLSEPEEASEPSADTAQSTMRSDGVSSSSRRKKKSASAVPPNESEAIENNRLETPSQQLSQGVAEHSVKRSQKHDSGEGQLQLVTQDPPLPEFFSSPVRRSDAIAGDATLNDVCHVGTACRAVGERGVICFSEDSGLTWQTQLTPMECSLRSVCFLTNKVGWVAGLTVAPGSSRDSAILLHTRDGGKSWQDLSEGQSERLIPEVVPTAALPGILHIQFFGLQEAIAVTLPVHSVGGAGIFRSDDGGRTWTPVPSDHKGCSWVAARFLNPAEGVVVGQNQTYATVVSDQAVVINPPQPTLRRMRAVSLSQEGNGWIVGDGSTILTTDDSGVTWQPPLADIPREITELVDLHAVAHEGHTVLMAGNPAGLLLRSGANGEDWHVLPIPATGQIHKLHFLSEDIVLAVGSFGQILRSMDRGVSWQCVRSKSLRSGLLNLVTNADSASWQLLAHEAAAQGIRSVVVQISQTLNPVETSTGLDRNAMSERTQLASSRIGGNDTASDWMFPRTKPEHHRSAAQLMSEWNRQTDGQLQRLLPMRLARDIRNWRPTVIVIEPISDDDAVAGILREVAARAIQLAESDDSDADVLSSIGLAPWRVERVFCRVPSDQRTSLSFDDFDLLPDLGTTIGLLCDSIDAIFPADLSTATLRPRASYEILMDRKNADSLAGIIDGLEPRLLIGAQRLTDTRSREEKETLKKVLAIARIEGAAIVGNSRLARAEESLTAELQNFGADLPETLALKQLSDLANMNLEQNNMEGYLAVQQEIIRRYPRSEAGHRAAEMLFLFYSSAETRYYRLRSAMQSPSPVNSTPANQASPLSGNSEGTSSDVAEPIVQRPETQTFSAGSHDHRSALEERWNMHAATALKILLTPGVNGIETEDMNPLVQLRIATNRRLEDLGGEHTNLLARLSQRDDVFGVIARSEMQLNASANPALPMINLPRRTERPFLDGKLTDTIWEDAEELTLRPVERRSTVAEGTDHPNVSGAGGNEPGSLAMLAWDDQFLYFSARLQRTPRPSRIVEQVVNRSHDARHEDLDRFEIEFDTDRDFSTSFQLRVDESGRTSEQCWMLNRWNPEWFVAVDADEQAWRVEAAIPLSELSSPAVKPGDTWAVRIRRVIPGVLQHEILSPARSISTQGTTLVRFIRPRVVTSGKAGKRQP